jgi:hypothetical protein
MAFLYHVQLAMVALQYKLGVIVKLPSGALAAALLMVRSPCICLLKLSSLAVMLLLSTWQGDTFLCPKGILPQLFSKRCLHFAYAYACTLLLWLALLSVVFLAL